MRWLASCNAMLTVLYKPAFIRQYQKLEASLQAEVKEKIALLRKDPRHPSLRTHKLGGKLSGRLSFSVNYSYRIVFIYQNKRTAVLLAVGDHDVYK